MKGQQVACRVQTEDRGFLKTRMLELDIVKSIQVVHMVDGIMMARIAGKAGNASRDQLHRVEQPIVVKVPSITKELTHVMIVEIVHITTTTVAAVATTIGQTIDKKISYNLNEESQHFDVGLSDPCNFFHIFENHEYI
jgi:hypothetical protein